MIQEQKLYTAQEINEMMNYPEERSSRNNGIRQLMSRATHAGLILEPHPAERRGLPNKYAIIENNLLLEGEIWVDCYCYDEWEVSNLGRVRKKVTKRLMGDTNGSSNGYVIVCGKNGNDNPEGKSINYGVHRLVYFSFHPEDAANSKTLQIDHINGIRSDNRLENLRCLSAAANVRAMADNQKALKSLMFQLVNKYGYKELEKKLLELL